VQPSWSEGGTTRHNFGDGSLPKLCPAVALSHQGVSCHVSLLDRGGSIKEGQFGFRHFVYEFYRWMDIVGMFEKFVQELPIECLVEMLTLVLKYNNFTFDGNHYLQINGTAMGTKMALSYANIFMGDLEERLLLSSLKQLLSWFMKWLHSDKELDEFFEHANSIHSHFGSHSCPIYLKIVVSVKSKIVAF
jgi:hypothetical protein